MGCRANLAAVFAWESKMNRRNKKKLAILVPVYKKTLNQLEQFSIDNLNSRINRRDIIIVSPESLDITYYRERYAGFGFKTFADRYFSSIVGYNHLLLDACFYESFSDFDYLLIHQTDALIFHDNLGYWMGKGYDYVGAPWPNGVEVTLKIGRFSATDGVNLKSYVGNGGFSLRSVKGCLAVLIDCKDLLAYWLESGSSEDLFFAFAGMVSENFRIPNQFTASRFSLELEPGKYFTINNEEIPTGCHAWWKHDLEFWKRVIARVG
jgi:hypothetical protein